MALLTAARISSLAIELLARLIVLPATVARVPGTEFTGDNGDTITVRVRAPRTAKTQATPGAAITFDALNETPVSLQVKHLYDAVRVTDEQLTLQIAEFGRQVLEPMMRSVAIGAEAQIATVMNAVVADASDLTQANIQAKVLLARTDLGNNNVPLTGRYLAVSPKAGEWLLNLDTFNDAAASGDTRSVRDGVIGRYRGFTVVESSALTGGALGAAMLAYHESAFVWGNRAPAIPNGAAHAEVSVADGIALRTVQDFDAAILSDVVAISTFAGANVVDLARVYKVRDA
jgi:hypothetical protein